MEKLRPYLVYIMRDDFSNLPLFVGVNSSVVEFLESVSACFRGFLEKDGMARGYEFADKFEDRVGEKIKVNIYDYYFENPGKRYPALNTTISVQEFSLGKVVEL